MSRIIATEGPGKVRNQHRRTIAEALRRLSQKSGVDDEARDLAALIVFCLHGIAESVDQTVTAWEKRDYYLKADRFRQEWRWVDPMADELSGMIHEGRWGEMAAVLAGLAPHFADVTVKQMTRKPALWRGAYRRLVEGG